MDTGRRDCILHYQHSVPVPLLMLTYNTLLVHHVKRNSMHRISTVRRTHTNGRESKNHHHDCDFCRTPHHHPALHLSHIMEYYWHVKHEYTDQLSNMQIAITSTLYHIYLLCTTKLHNYYLNLNTIYTCKTLLCKYFLLLLTLGANLDKMHV